MSFLPHHYSRIKSLHNYKYCFFQICNRLIYMKSAETLVISLVRGGNARKSLESLACWKRIFFNTMTFLTHATLSSDFPLSPLPIRIITLIYMQNIFRRFIQIWDGYIITCQFYSQHHISGHSAWVMFQIKPTPFFIECPRNRKLITHNIVFKRQSQLISHYFWTLNHTCTFMEVLIFFPPIIYFPLIGKTDLSIPLKLKAVLPWKSLPHFCAGALSPHWPPHCNFQLDLDIRGSSTRHAHLSSDSKWCSSGSFPFIGRVPATN